MEALLGLVVIIIFVAVPVVGLIIWSSSRQTESPDLSTQSVQPRPEVHPNPAVTRSGQTVGTETFGHSDEITSGKEGTIYEIRQHRLLDVEGEMVYKQISDPNHDVRGQFDALSAFVDARPTHAKEHLLRHTAWPLQLANDGGIAKGFVMRMATPEFRILVTGPKGPRATLADLTFLASDDSYLRKREIAPLPTLQDRIGILGGLADLLAVLHEGGAVYGDLSLVNIAYSTRPAGVLLLDCDSIRVPGSPPTLMQLDAPELSPPESGRPTTASDVYKFAHVTQYVLSQPLHAPAEVDRHARTVERLPGPDGQLLLARSLGDDPAHRPSIREWANFLLYGSPHPSPPHQPPHPPPPSPPPPPPHQPPPPLPHRLQHEYGFVKDENGQWVSASPKTPAPAHGAGTVVGPQRSGWVRDPVTGEWHRIEIHE